MDARGAKCPGAHAGRKETVRGPTQAPAKGQARRVVGVYRERGHMAGGPRGAPSFTLDDGAAVTGSTNGERMPDRRLNPPVGAG